MRVHHLLIEKLSLDGLKCCHLNVNGLFSKLDEIKLLLFETKIDILTITESHLNSQIHDYEISIQDYSFIRKDRSGRGNSWGGVIVYHKDNLDVCQLDKYELFFSPTESICLEVTSAAQKLLLACIYRPPDDKNFIQQFEKAVEAINHRRNLVILGDLNIDLSPEISKTLSITLKRTLVTNNLINVIKGYTRITSSTKSLIDHIITSNPDRIITAGSFETCISDHNIVYAVYKLKTKRAPPKLITVNDYKSINKKDLQYDLQSAPWDLIDMFDDVDDAVWCWESIFKEIFSGHLKQRKVKVSAKNEPWMTRDIRKALNNRFRLFKKAIKQGKNTVAWTNYKTMRNNCTKLIRTAKANYWKQEFQKCTNSKSFWSTVKKFQGKSKSTNIGPLIQSTDLVTDNYDKANLMNDFFSTVGKNLANKLCTSDSSSLTHVYKVTPTVSSINLKDIEKAFKSTVKLGKASGPDGISPTDLKLCEDTSMYTLQKVIKKAVDCLKFPKSWKVAKVSCIYKKGAKNDCSNYRPISLLSIPSKVFERCLCSTICDHIESHNLLSCHQWGFRKNHSTEDLLLHQTETWHKALDEGKCIAVLFIDYQKAFDSVSHSTVLLKLAALGISGDLLEIIQDYLSDRKQFTIVNGCKSSTAHIEFGVPQGSILGPVSFSANVNDLPDKSDNQDGETNLFADDSTAFEIGSNADDALNKINITAKNIEAYSRSNSLTIHPKKCKLVLISRKNYYGPMQNVQICGSSVEIVNSTKCLGIEIDSKLSWNNQIDTVCKNFNAKLKKLYTMRLQSSNTLETIYFSGILPTALYSIVVWGNSCRLHEVNKIHARAARFVRRLPKKLNDEEALLAAGWKSIDFYYKKAIACKAFKIYYELSPPSLNNLLTKNTSRSTRNKYKVVQPSFKSNHYKRSFSYRASVVWNNLSNEIRSKPSIDSFKLFLKKFSKEIQVISFGTIHKTPLSDFIYY